MPPFFGAKISSTLARGMEAHHGYLGDSAGGPGPRVGRVPKKTPGTLPKNDPGLEA